MLIWMECHDMYNLSDQNNEPELLFLFVLFNISKTVE
jgi:hypothetical protein